MGVFFSHLKQGWGLITMTNNNSERLVRDMFLPGGWERVIGEAREDDPVTTFTDSGSWFDVSIYQSENGYDIVAKQGPIHPHQEKNDRDLRKQHGVTPEMVETVAIGFMMCASDMDPFTNKFTAGMSEHLN